MRPVPKLKRIEDRKAIAEERKPYCEVCGAPGHGEPHHIITRGSGGPDIPENLIQLCYTCHYGRVPSGELDQFQLLLYVARRMGLTYTEVSERVRRAKRGV